MSIDDCIDAFFVIGGYLVKLGLICVLIRAVFFM